MITFRRADEKVMNIVYETTTDAVFLLGTLKGFNTAERKRACLYAPSKNILRESFMREGFLNKSTACARRESFMDKSIVCDKREGFMRESFDSERRS